MSFPSRSSSKMTGLKALIGSSSRLVPLGLALAALGCDVTLFPEIVRQPTSNTCESPSSCGDDGKCVEGRCQTDFDQIQIPAFLLEVTPAASVETSPGRPAIGGMSFTSVIEEFDRGPSGYEINLDHVSEISGAVTAPRLAPANCIEGPEGEMEPESGDGSVPARLTLTPRQRLLGLPSPSYTAESDTLVNVGDGLSGIRIALNVPPGRYDIYVEPKPSVGGCLRPPFLIVDQEVPPGMVELNLSLPVPEVIPITVRYPRASDDLKDWTIDIIQKDSGRLLSTRVSLQEPVERNDALEYDVRLALHTQGTGGAVASELVRLSPPEGLVAPTIFLERSLIDLFQEGVGLVDQLKELDDAVSYSGRVAATGLGLTDPVPSIVSWYALELESSNPGTTAGFSRSVETDEQGEFETLLLPGTYRVLTTPLDDTYARKVLEVTVSDASESQSGRTIEVLPRNEVSGELVSFDGSRIFGAAIDAQAVPAEERVDVLEAARGAIATAPSAVGDLSGDNGDFVLRTDTGVFNISARPDPSTGFAWAVRLGVDISENQDLPRLELPLPVVVRGRLLSPTEGLVSGALIRVFALLKDGNLATTVEEAESVVGVAEARVNAEGKFELLLPSAFK